MIVTVTPDVRIRFDGTLNYDLETRSIVGEAGRNGKVAKAENVGKEKWTTVGHYGDWKSAAQALLGRHLYLLANDTVATMPLMTLVGHIDRAAALVANAFKKPAEDV